MRKSAFQSVLYPVQRKQGLLLRQRELLQTGSRVLISLYLLYFYTNVMHLNAGAVSIMFLVTKFIDGVSDLIVGYLIDKTNTRWGKSRPWIRLHAKSEEP